MPSGARDPRLKSGARLRCLAIVRARGEPCCRCGRPINYQLRHRAGRPNPAAFVGDEIISRRDGGDPTDPANVRAAHHRCNAQAGARVTNAIRRAQRATEPTLVLDDW